jgi:hypothetical protein
MKKVFALVLVVGALFWAKKRFVDEPTPPVQSETEAAAEKIGGVLASAKKGQQSAPKAEGLSAMLSSLLGGSKESTPEAKAKARVETFMKTWKEGGTSVNDAAQAAACLWSRGVRFIPDKDEIQDAANGFDRWRHEKNLYVEITTYSVGDVSFRASNPGRGEYNVLTISINGQPYRIGVPDGPNPIFWID